MACSGQSLVAAMADALAISCVRDFRADDDAVLVIGGAGPQQGDASCGSAAVYRFAGRMPTAKSVCSLPPPPLTVRCLFFGCDRRSRSPGSRTCPPMPALPPRSRVTAHARSPRLASKLGAGGAAYGGGDSSNAGPRRAGKGYVLGVSSAHVFRSWGRRAPVAGYRAGTAPTRRPSDPWRGPWEPKERRPADWCYLELADLGTEDTNSAGQGLWTRGPADPSSYCRRRSRLLHHLVSGRNIDRNAGRGRRPSVGDRGRFAGPRRTSSGSITNEEIGGISLVMLAFAMMAAIRHRANPPLPKKPNARTTTERQNIRSRH